MRFYHGERGPSGCEVEVIDSDNPKGGYALEPRRDLRSHEAPAYDWGYSDAGSAQLSLALLADALGDDHEALRRHQDFMFKVVARLPRDRWELSQEDILHHHAALSRGRQLA